MARPSDLIDGEKIRYVIVGVLTTVVSLGSYYLFTVTLLDPSNPFELQVANVLSWICAVAFAYVTNRAYVFASKDGNVLAEAARFVVARLTTLLIDMVCMGLFVSVLVIDDRIAKLFVQVIVFVLNYVFSKFMVFVKR